MDASLDEPLVDVNPHGWQEWTKVVFKDFGGGHAEVSASRYDTWAEPDPHADEDAAKKVLRGESDNREDNIIRSSRRSRAKMRERCKMIKARYMVTLTTREVLDVDAFHRVFDRFMRRVREARAFGAYVAVPELQERGATHVHIAVARKQDYKLLWALWRAVTGPGGGSVDVTKGFSKHNTHRIACYMSKYLGKAFEDAGLNRKRYWCSKGIEEPKRETFLLPAGMDQADIGRWLGEFLTARGFVWSFGDCVTGLGDCLMWMHVSPERYRIAADAVVSC